MSNPILVSVVIPVYNAEKYLQETLESICNQTLAEIEIICVDDGSTDRSHEMLRGWAALDSRINIIRQENAGPGAARNAGLQAASGEYLAFLDADDLYESDMLATMYKQAKRQADVVVCRCDYFSTNPALRNGTSPIPKKRPDCILHPAGEIAESIFQICVGWPWDKLFRTEYIRAHGWDYPPLRNSEDGVFVFPAIAHAQTMVFCSQILVHHREHPGSVSKTLNRWPTECVKAMQLIHERLGSLQQHPGIMRSFCAWARHYTAWNLRELQYEARPALREAVRDILEPLFKLSAIPATVSSEYMDYQSIIRPAARVEIVVEQADLGTLHECILSIEQQQLCAAEIVLMPRDCTIPCELAAGTRAYPALPGEASCPVLRLPACRGVKWNALEPVFISRAAACGAPIASGTYDIRKRGRFYARTATTRSWRLWGRGILTLSKGQNGTSVFLFGTRLGK